MECAILYWLLVQEHLCVWIRTRYIIQYKHSPVTPPPFSNFLHLAAGEQREIPQEVWRLFPKSLPYLSDDDINDVEKRVNFEWLNRIVEPFISTALSRGHQLRPSLAMFLNGCNDVLDNSPFTYLYLLELRIHNYSNLFNGSRSFFKKAH